ncbi:MAG: InlB B-repeat-containing protein, partial [Ruminococcus sp.]|nr:InlB B-repeat-containing protein [Ruminococcus sp.]
MVKKTHAKKFLSVLLAVLMMVSVFVPSISAADITVKSGILIPDDYDSKSYEDVKVLEDLVDMDEFRQYLFEGFYTCPTYLDISKFKIPKSNISAITNLIWNEMPEMFQISSMSYYYSSSSGILTMLNPSYHFTAEEYPEMLEASRKAADAMVADLVDSDLSDAEKALLVHDRLVAFCEYDYDAYRAGSIPRTSRNIYGALVLGESVCQGYALTYEYLLDKVGIESHYSSSDALNHAWNIVYIDGDPYYVDTTWDDPVWDVNGRVYHTNFLVSYDVFGASHDATDYEVPQPQSSTYDSMYWRSVESGFQYLNGKFYYIDVRSNEIKEITDITDVSTSKSIYDLGQWRVDNYYWSDNLSKLSSDGEYLLYSQPRSICRLDVNTGESTVIWEPTPPADMTRPFISGFNYDGTYLTAVYNTSSNFGEDTKNLYTQKKLYDTQAPTAEITSTNNVAPAQTVTLSLSDNVQIDGYYWGTNKDYTQNTYSQTSAETVDKLMSQDGTYYLTVKDTSGNVSKTYSVTFYKTAFNVASGSVSPSYVITESGKSFVLPDATRNGYNHNGWATASGSSAAYQAGAEYAPTKSATLYSVWSCNHEKYNSSVTKEATCTEEGVMTYTCATCGDTYTETITKKAHTVVVDKAVAATCTTAGKTEGSHCSVCGTVIVEQSTIVATDHIYTSKVTKAATCTAEGVKTFTCSKCNDTYTETIAKTAHTVVIDKAVAATCTTAGKTEGSHCSVCGTVIVEQSTIAATDHSYTSKVTKAATCTAEGVKTFTCSKCNDTYTETIAKTAHTVVIDKAVTATCMAVGKTEGSHCSVCGTVIVEQQEIAKKAHTPVTDAAVAATCTKTGKTEGSHCSVCDTVIVAQQTVPTKAHEYTSEITKEATCSAEGVRTYACKNCTANYTEAIAKIAHTSVKDAAVASTCTKTGKTEGSHCSVCGTVIVAQQTVPTKAHEYTSEITKEATCSAEGVRTYACKN